MLMHVPNIDDVVRKWSSNEYLKQQFGSAKLKVTTSTSNHFMVGMSIYARRRPACMTTSQSYQVYTCCVAPPVARLSQYYRKPKTAMGKAPPPALADYQ